MSDVLFDLIYYIYIMLFGVYICLRLGCGRLAKREWWVFGLLCPALLLLQGICLQLWGMDAVWMMYPLVVHLPMALALMLPLKVKWNAAVVSVVVSYSLCQLPRWVGLVLGALEVHSLPALLIHVAASQIILMLLDRYCLDALHRTLGSFRRLLLYFGALPLIYYLYEYFMMYTRQRFINIQALSELLPTCLVLFFVLFAVAYQRELQRLENTRRETAALEMRIRQAEREVASLRSLQEQTAIYRHDFRHHLRIIGGMISDDQNAQAIEYIRAAQQDIDRFTPKRYCENETVNLLLSAFQAKAQQAGARMRVRAALPAQLGLPDTELCALLCNALENAVHAVSQMEDGSIDLSCILKQSRLLIEIRNSYEGEIAFEDEIPVSRNSGSHYGCRSIQAIVQRRKGMCSFAAEDGVFTLRIAIPMLD